MATSSITAARHPECATSIGTSAPAATPPIGTPVCLIDMTSAAVRAVVRGPKICELAGFIAAVPQPMVTGASAAVAALGDKRNNSPTPANATLARLNPIPPI
jgi:hypothetical protein